MGGPKDGDTDARADQIGALVLQGHTWAEERRKLGAAASAVEEQLREAREAREAEGRADNPVDTKLVNALLEEREVMLTQMQDLMDKHTQLTGALEILSPRSVRSSDRGDDRGADTGADTGYEYSGSPQAAIAGEAGNEAAAAAAAAAAASADLTADSTCSADTKAAGTAPYTSSTADTADAAGTGGTGGTGGHGGTMSDGAARDGAARTADGGTRATPRGRLGRSIVQSMDKFMMEEVLREVEIEKENEEALRRTEAVKNSAPPAPSNPLLLLGSEQDKFIRYYSSS